MNINPQSWRLANYCSPLPAVTGGGMGEGQGKGGQGWP